MERREFLRAFSAGTVAAFATHVAWRADPRRHLVFDDFDTDGFDLTEGLELMRTPTPNAEAILEQFTAKPRLSPPATKGSRPLSPDELGVYLRKMRRFEADHNEDVFVDPELRLTMVSTFERLERVQEVVGHGNFNVISFDEMLRSSRLYSRIGAFTRSELDFLEAIFTERADRYGFFGEKVQTDMTAVVPARDRYKVPYTGHYLYRGESFALYEKVCRDLGRSIILTSGIRSIVKQTYLFLAKTIDAGGNLSRASRSLAPPGHSFHGVGDFDVGKIGLGRRNFTAAFAATPEFRKLVDLGYIRMRYPQDNLLGVRFEPWHIKVA